MHFYLKEGRKIYRKHLRRFVFMSRMIAEISLRFFTRKFIASLWCFSLSSFLFPELTSIP